MSSGEAGRYTANIMGQTSPILKNNSKMATAAFPETSVINLATSSDDSEDSDGAVFTQTLKKTGAKRTQPGKLGPKREIEVFVRGRGTPMKKKCPNQFTRICDDQAESGSVSYRIQIQAQSK